MRITRELQSLSNVAAGLTATLECKAKLTYDKIMFEYSGITRAQMKNIEVVINGKVVQTYKDAVELQDINNYYERGDNAGFVTLHFARPEMETLIQQRMTAIGTADVSTFSVNIAIDAAAAAPKIVAHAQLSEQMNLGVITKVKAFPYSTAVVGEVQIDNIPLGPRIQAVHFFNSDISNLEVELDSQKVFDSSKALAEIFQKEAGRTPVTAKAFHFDTQLENDNAQAMITAGAGLLNFKPTFDSAGSARLVVEYLDGLNGI